EAIWLLSPELIVVASPSLVSAGIPIEKPADCLKYPLLHSVARKDWPLWFEAQGVIAPGGAKGHAFSDHQLILGAAVAGQGLALVRDVYVQQELKNGKLVKVLSVSWPTQFGYYAVATPESLQKPAVRRFRDWLVQESRRAALHLISA